MSLYNFLGIRQAHFDPTNIAIINEPVANEFCWSGGVESRVLDGINILSIEHYILEIPAE